MRTGQSRVSGSGNEHAHLSPQSFAYSPHRQRRPASECALSARLGSSHHPTTNGAPHLRHAHSNAHPHVPERSYASETTALGNAKNHFDYFLPRRRPLSLTPHLPLRRSIPRPFDTRFVRRGRRGRLGRLHKSRRFPTDRRFRLATIHRPPHATQLVTSQSYGAAILLLRQCTLFVAKIPNLC